MTPALFKADLNAGSGPITVWINSPGGDCVAAAQIYNMLMDYPGDVTVKVDGIAASAASVIAMAGTRVLMSPVSTMMIHNPLTVAMGDSDEMRRAIQMLDEVKESIINAYEIKTGLSRTRLSHLMDAETWMNANKALELGFCDEIMFRREEAEADAEDSFLYSSRAVTNCLLNKLKAHAPKPEPRVKRQTSKRGWRFCTPHRAADSRPAFRSLNKFRSLQPRDAGPTKKEEFSMNQILELREKRAKAWDAAKAFLDSSAAQTA